MYSVERPYIWLQARPVIGERNIILDNMHKQYPLTMITIEVLRSEKEGLEKLRHNSFCAMADRKEYSGFEMTVESNHAIALVLVLLVFFHWLLSPLKNGEQLLYQLDTNSTDWCWLTSKPSRLVKPSVVLLCRFLSSHLVF